MPSVKKENKKQAAKRPVKLVALEVPEGKSNHKAGTTFYATEETAANLIKKKFAKKATTGTKKEADK